MICELMTNLFEYQMISKTWDLPDIMSPLKINYDYNVLHIII